MLILFIRTIILYTLVVTALRLMGKRQIGELQPSELVVAIMISDLATVPMSEVGVPLLYGIIPIFTLVISEIMISYISLRSEKVRILLSGRPQILVRNGKLCFKEMKKCRVNIDDLIEELRKAGYYSLSEVETVILETGGSITVIPTPGAMQATLDDLNIKKEATKLPFIYIADGKIRTNELERSGKSQKWLGSMLKKSGISSADEVFIMMEDSNQKIYLQKRKDKNER